MEVISVIVPAHNEARVIKRLLKALTDGAEPGELEIVVVCNGCSDATAEAAREIIGPIRVIETDKASKTHAMNLGDNMAKGYPRFYVDADLILDIKDLRKVVTELKKPSILAAAPEFKFDLSKSSPAVQAYYRIWQRMPYFDTGRIAGAYGLSESGRNRFGLFPEVISDDGYVRLHFKPDERLTVKNANVIVTAPKTVRDLVKIKVRSHSGSVELRRKYPALFSNETASSVKSLRRLFSHGLPINEVMVYFFVSVVAKFRGKIQLLSGKSAWERDESSR